MRFMHPPNFGKLAYSTIVILLGTLFNIFLCMASLADEPTLPDKRRVCHVRNMQTLSGCFADPSHYDVFRFAADVSCENPAQCCPPGAKGLVSFERVADKVVQGDGHVIRRSAAQRTCPAVSVVGSQRISIEGLAIDEDDTAPPCEYNTKDCSATVNIRAASDIKIIDLGVYSAKGYAVSVWSSGNVEIRRAAISNAGIIGIYAGHYKYGVSRDLTIADLIISRSRANGIALQGVVSGFQGAPTLIAGNFLNNNHWHGVWPVRGVPGGLTSGGQILIADGSNISLTDNIIADGACDACKPSGQTVTAVEIADQAPPPAGVSHLRIERNLFLNGRGAAIRQNPGTTVSDVVVAGNQAVGFNTIGEIKPPAAMSRNTIVQENTPPISHSPNYGAVVVTVDEHRAVRRLDAEPGQSNPTEEFELSPTPRPHADVIPILLCKSPGDGGTYIPLKAINCGNKGGLQALLGYSFAANSPAAKPFFACSPTPLSAPATLLSWDSTCNGRGKPIRLGYALDARHDIAYPTSRDPR